MSICTTLKEIAMGDENRGLYEKFKVTRTDGSSEPGGKHEGCRYFVLDLTHDEFAASALRAYGMACRRDYPALSADLLQIATDLEQVLQGKSDGSSMLHLAQSLIDSSNTL
jgi:hypothetical protein